MAFLPSLALALVTAAAPVHVQHLTGCSTCCGDGGNCSAAFKRGPGICCGVRGHKPFCCPSGANAMGAATCVSHGPFSFRCKSSGGAKTGRRGHLRSSGGGGHSSSSNAVEYDGFFVVVALFALLMRCCNRNRSRNGQNGMPVYQPVANNFEMPGLPPPGFAACAPPPSAPPPFGVAVGTDRDACTDTSAPPPYSDVMQGGNDGGGGGSSGGAALSFVSGLSMLSRTAGDDGGQRGGGARNYDHDVYGSDYDASSSTFAADGGQYDDCGDFAADS